MDEPWKWAGPNWSIRRIPGANIEFDLYLVRIGERGEFVVREWAIAQENDGPERARVTNPHGQHIVLPGPIVRTFEYNDEPR